MKTLTTVLRTCVVVLALASAPLAFGAESSQFSEAERRVFTDKHLAGLKDATTIEYSYQKRGSLEAVADDKIVLMIGAAKQPGGRSVKVQYLSGQRRFELPDVQAAESNPVILFFLERETREMNRLTGGAARYYQKRIRMALAETAQLKPAKTKLGSREVAATEVHLAPYRDDPARLRYEKFADKTYVLTFSPEVPGGVVELRSELVTRDGGESRIVIAESVRFVGSR